MHGKRHGWGIELQKLRTVYLQAKCTAWTVKHPTFLSVAYRANLAWWCYCTVEYYCALVALPLLLLCCLKGTIHQDVPFTSVLCWPHATYCNSFRPLMSSFCVISSRGLINLSFGLLNKALMSCYAIWLSGNAYLCDILGDPAAASRGRRKWRFRRAISSAPQLSAAESTRIPLWQHCALLMLIWKKCKENKNIHSGILSFFSYW